MENHINHYATPDDFDREELDDYEDAGSISRGCAKGALLGAGGLLLLLAVLLFACCRTPQIVMPEIKMPQVVYAPTDTILEIRERTVTDTIEFAPEWVGVHDTVPCPPGLLRDTVLYRTRTVTLPARTLYVPRLVRDTVRVERQVVHNVTGGVGSPSWWLGLAALLAAIFTAWRVAGKKQGS